MASEQRESTPDKHYRYLGSDGKIHQVEIQANQHEKGDDMDTKHDPQNDVSVKILIGNLNDINNDKKDKKQKYQTEIKIEDIEIDENYEFYLTLKQMKLSKYFQRIDILKQYSNLKEQEIPYISNIIQSSEIIRNMSGEKSICDIIAEYVFCPNIVIVGVSANILTLVVEYLQHHNGVAPPEIAKPIRSVKMERIVGDPWDAQFINKCSKKDVFQLILACAPGRLGMCWFHFNIIVCFFILLTFVCRVLLFFFACVTNELPWEYIYQTHSMCF